mgnify:FL=1|tara:strand:- start:38 stop:298 length:261 start_codon:yes stop_codon:yes gene_type:complete
MATQDEIESLYVSGPNSILGQDKRSLSEILGGNYNFDKPIKEIKLDLMDKGFEVSKKSSKKSKPTKVATAQHGGLAKRGYGVARRG